LGSVAARVLQEVGHRRRACQRRRPQGRPTMAWNPVPVVSMATVARDSGLGNGCTAVHRRSACRWSTGAQFCDAGARPAQCVRSLRPPCRRPPPRLEGSPCAHAISACPPGSGRVLLVLRQSWPNRGQRVGASREEVGVPAPCDRWASHGRRKTCTEGQSGAAGSLLPLPALHV